jgi:hypothetical protein
VNAVAPYWHRTVGCLSFFCVSISPVERCRSRLAMVTSSAIYHSGLAFCTYTSFGFDENSRSSYTGLLSFLVDHPS